MFNESELEDMDMRREMAKPQPHEPVSHQWWSFTKQRWSGVWGSRTLCDNPIANFDTPCRITLANGQRIIVRALSEDRKAARRERRREKCVKDWLDSIPDEVMMMPWVK